MSTTRPFIAARVEEFIDRRIEGLLRGLGWREKVICYTGYGSSESIRVLGRVVLVPNRARGGLAKATEDLIKRRGFRNFFSAACVRAAVTITVGDQVVTASTDRGGYIDERIRNHQLAPGWQQVGVRSRSSKMAAADVHVVGDEVTFGIVSDIDDTIISTWLPRPMIAAWNSFIRDESARQSVPGMARMYTGLLADHPGAPVLYISTGAWNTHGFLSRFLKRHGYPHGAMLLTDWGPTNTGWFRSGMAHKADALLQLTRDFPRISWVLVGDDGQHDPVLYANFAHVAPDRVRAIAIRQLSATEQVLAHGTTSALPEEQEAAADTPWVEAPDGRGLLAGLRALPEPL
ncbi:App1 family protein [Propionicimonas sp.]|uniref:App1 family protein n=1 Tax=Propionicimonas sp. TaxID=1955623 RepID=UPI0039E29A06